MFILLYEICPGCCCMVLQVLTIYQDSFTPHKPAKGQMKFGRTRRCHTVGASLWSNSARDQGLSAVSHHAAVGGAVFLWRCKTNCHHQKCHGVSPAIVGVLLTSSAQAKLWVIYTLFTWNSPNGFNKIRQFKFFCLLPWSVVLLFVITQLLGFTSWWLYSSCWQSDSTFTNV